MYKPPIQPETCYRMLIAQSNILSLAFCVYTLEKNTQNNCRKKLVITPNCVTDLECNDGNIIVASEYFSEQDKVDRQSH